MANARRLVLRNVLPKGVDLTRRARGGWRQGFHQAVKGVSKRRDELRITGSEWSGKTRVPIPCTARPNLDGKRRGTLRPP